MSMIGAKGDGESWGLDHGAWSVLRALYPDADVPVIQLSLNCQLSAADHYALGRQLVSLRNDNVLILGSGNVVHNLRYFRSATKPFDWAIRFNDAAKAKIATRDHKALIAYDTLTPDARLSVPTSEHYLPLLYALAAQGADEKVEVLTDDVLTSLSMTSVAIGLG